MKHYKEIEIPARIEERLDKITCDVCGAVIRKKHPTSAEKAEIIRTTGYNSPEGGSGTEISVDICCECFDTKIIPWLKSQGIKLQVRDWEW
jgi:hypothetical protein